MQCFEIHPHVATPNDEQRELDDPLEWLPSGELERQSQVARFYEGAAVFLTGATGFIGTLILEKLLRSCPGISKVYVLIRDKKGVPLQERLQSHLEKEIFSKARQACPDYLSKVVAIAGDCSQKGLGISAADVAELCSKVSIVFHVAAIVRFDADLRTAAITNVGSTCDTIKLVKCMASLKAFVYMSTAYSNAHMHLIQEKFYHPALKAKELLKLISIMDDEQLMGVLPLLLGDWPNTYTFTKAVAEDVIRDEAAGLPFSIIRPSIVTVTYREPVALWAGNMYGPNTIAAGGAVGLLHALHIDCSALADGVPADMVANATIACAWDTWCGHSQETSTQQTPPEPVIYNCVSSPRHPLTWGDVSIHTLSGVDYPSMKSIWICYTLRFKAKYLYVITAVLFHLIPAVIADTFLRLMGMKPLLWNLYSRLHGTLQALEPFMNGEWRFTDDNLVFLLGRLDAADRKLFPFDIAEVDSEWLLTNGWRGLRLYLLNESFDNLEEARKRYRRLRVLHYIVVASGSALLLYLLWRIGTAVIGL